MTSSPPSPTTSHRQSWTALALPGLTLDSLGNYLAALGLLTMTTRKWPTVRGCWKDERFILVNGPTNEAELQIFMGGVAEQREWSPYEKAWDKFQKADTKAKGSGNSAFWRSQIAEESALPLYHSHLALGAKLSFNPLFGTGGNSGKRDFSKGWERAAALLKKPPKGFAREALLADLRAFLHGQPCNCLADFNAACWFSAANKAFNSGMAKPFREGQITPWAMLLACEGFPLLRGSASRLLGSQRRSVGAFPFVTAPAAPESAGEAGRSIGEAWLPVWERPMGLPEVEMMLARGRAEVNGRGAVTAPAFAAAIVQRGVDAGLVEFRRFVLIRTTSENTFESRLATILPCKGPAERVRSEAVAAALVLREALPRDRKQGKRWIYSGLRGPLDRALIEYSASPNAESARDIVDAAVAALKKVDRNRTHRAAMKSFRPLPGEWLRELCGSDSTPEMRLALATASLNAAPGTPPLLAYWLGAEPALKEWRIPESVPFRRVWAPATTARNLAAIVLRRLVDRDEATERPPFQAQLSASIADAELWLRGEIDETEFDRWLFRFSLFKFDKPAVEFSRTVLQGQKEFAVVGAEIALFALFKPLFAPQAFTQVLRDTSKRKTPRCATVARLAALLLRGDLDAAVSAGRRTWHAAGVPLADWQIEFHTPDADAFAERLLASMLLPIRAGAIAQVFQRWRLPINPNKNQL